MVHSQKKHAVFIAIFSFVAFLILLPSVLKVDGLSNFDLFFENILAGLRAPALTSLFIAITDIGNALVLAPLSAALYFFLLWKRRFYESFFFAVSMFLGAVFVLTLKALTHIPRPTGALIQESDFSFPSGHATMTTIFFLILGFLFRNQIRNKAARFIFEAACVFVIILVGFSRIYLGVHRPSEVAAGFLVGIFCVSISSLVIYWFRKKLLTK